MSYNPAPTIWTALKQFKQWQKSGESKSGPGHETGGQASRGAYCEEMFRHFEKTADNILERCLTELRDEQRIERVIASGFYGDAKEGTKREWAEHEITSRLRAELKSSILTSFAGAMDKSLRSDFQELLLQRAHSSEIPHQTAVYGQIIEDLAKNSITSNEAMKIHGDVTSAIHRYQDLEPGRLPENNIPQPKRESRGR